MDTDTDQKQRELALRVMEEYRRDFPANGNLETVEAQLADIKERAADLKAAHAELVRRKGAIVAFDEVAMPFLLSLLQVMPSADKTFLMLAMRREFGEKDKPKPDTTAPLSMGSLKPKRRKGKGGRPKTKPATAIDPDTILASLDHEGLPMAAIKEAVGYTGDSDPVRVVLRELVAAGKARVTGIRGKTRYHLV